ncbi:MAG: hypothetical protein ABJH07_02190, partial [Sedimentitalea sp.]
VRDAVLCFGDLIATGIIEFVGHGPSLASEKTMGIPRPGDPCNTLVANHNYPHSQRSRCRLYPTKRPARSMFWTGYFHLIFSLSSVATENLTATELFIQIIFTGVKLTILENLERLIDETLGTARSRGCNFKQPTGRTYHTN